MITITLSIPMITIKLSIPERLEMVRIEMETREREQEKRIAWIGMARCQLTIGAIRAGRICPDRLLLHLPGLGTSPCS